MRRPIQLGQKPRRRHGNATGRHQRSPDIWPESARAKDPAAQEGPTSATTNAGSTAARPPPPAHDERLQAPAARSRGPSLGPVPFVCSVDPVLARSRARVAPAPRLIGCRSAKVSGVTDRAAGRSVGAASLMAHCPPGRRQTPKEGRVPDRGQTISRPYQSLQNWSIGGEPISVAFVSIRLRFLSTTLPTCRRNGLDVQVTPLLVFSTT